MGEPVLQVTDLTKRFGKVTSVDGISFELPKGEILGLLGANGAGKTTAINMVLGIISPTAGRVEVFGKELSSARIPILRRMNFCSTYTQLPGNLRVWQNLKVFGKLYRVKNLIQRIDEVLEMLEISHLRNRVTGELSAGESTRLNLCKALMNRPELLLLDEPTASLDPDIADKVRKVVSRIREEENTTILYTSHNMRDVEEVCDRVIFMHKGKILFGGTTEEMLQHFEEESLEDVFIRVARGGDIENPRDLTPPAEADREEGV
ncbi:MAG: ABC transporter ATP-binding protein [Verrucomicrobiales bacterium]|nr:ABC transporter ATP-binding protein [Verrucomicrobiales bacterium]